MPTTTTRALLSSGEAEHRQRQAEEDALPSRNGAVRHSVSDSLLETLLPRGGPAIAAHPAPAAFPRCEALLAPHAAGCSQQTAQPVTPRHPMHKGFFFFCFTHRSLSLSPCSTSAACSQRQPGARRRSHGGPCLFL